jgi:hypothetical protein
MASARIGLSDDELTSLARVSGRDPVALADELAARPWAIHDVLAEPRTVEAVLHPDSPFDTTSPFVLFAVMTRLAADELHDSTYVNDWVGPRSRLPVFDVEPLQEFVDAPARVLFVARLLASMVVPTTECLPIHTADPWELLDWIDAVDGDSRVALLRRLGDAALFLAGVHADALGNATISVEQVDKVARSLDVAADDVLELIDDGSVSPGIEALETLGACWYQAARQSAPSVPPIVADVAERIRPARRFLTHLADSYLTPGDAGLEFAG